MSEKKEEKTPALRPAFEEMTLKMIEEVIGMHTGNISPDIVREIRENVRALGYIV